MEFDLLLEPCPTQAYSFIGEKVAPLGEKSLSPVALHPTLLTTDHSARSNQIERPIEHNSTTLRPRIDAISQACALGGRLLILSTAVLIFAMPWTEYF